MTFQKRKITRAALYCERDETRKAQVSDRPEREACEKRRRDPRRMPRRTLRRVQRHVQRKRSEHDDTIEAGQPGFEE